MTRVLRTVASRRSPVAGGLGFQETPLTQLRVEREHDEGAWSDEDDVVGYGATSVETL